jgi:hypothetical protein
MNVTIEQSWILDYWPIISDGGKVIGVIIQGIKEPLDRPKGRFRAEISESQERTSQSD